MGILNEWSGGSGFSALDTLLGQTSYFPTASRWHLSDDNRGISIYLVIALMNSIAQVTNIVGVTNTIDLKTNQQTVARLELCGGMHSHLLYAGRSLRYTLAASGFAGEEQFGSVRRLWIEVSRVQIVWHLLGG